MGTVYCICSAKPTNRGFRKPNQVSDPTAGDLFHCDAQWQYLATTQHGDVYEVVIDASKLKDTPPTIVRRVAYNNAPLLLFENAVVKITLHPDAQSASTLPK